MKALRYVLPALVTGTLVSLTSCAWVKKTVSRENKAPSVNQVAQVKAPAAVEKLPDSVVADHSLAMNDRPEGFLPELTLGLTPNAENAPNLEAPLPPLRSMGRPMVLRAGVPFQRQALPRASSPATAEQANLPDEVARFNHPQEDSMQVRTTAYCHDEADHLPYDKFAAAGNVLKYGSLRSAAADWSRYPLGTRFRIAGEPGVVYQIDDYGSALVGSGTIDLYRPTMEEMDAWGVRNVDIEIIQWGSYEDSLKLLRDSTKFPHVRRMVSEIENKTTQVDVKEEPQAEVVPVIANR